jgi:hypothetical protein
MEKIVPHLTWNDKVNAPELKIWKLSDSNNYTKKNCERKTQDELRQLHAESLWLNTNSTWEEIEKKTEDNLNEWEIPDTSCFFNLETWDNACYIVPEIIDSCIDEELEN